MASICTLRLDHCPIRRAEKGDTGNGIAVYTFSDGKVAPQGFIPIAPQPLSTEKKVAVGLKAPPHTAIPYPAGLRSFPTRGQDKLLVANNLSDNVVLLDPATGKILQTFDLSTSDLVPSSFPYTVSQRAMAGAPGAACGTHRRWRNWI